MAADNFTIDTYDAIIFDLRARIEAHAAEVPTLPRLMRPFLPLGSLVGLSVFVISLSILVTTRGTPEWLETFVKVVCAVSILLAVVWPIVRAHRQDTWCAAQNQAFARIAHEVLALPSLRGSFTEQELACLARLFTKRYIRVPREGWRLTDGEIAIRQREAVHLAFEQEPGMQHALLASEADKHAERQATRLIPVYALGLTVMTLGVAMLNTPTILFRPLLGASAAVIQLLSSLALLAISVGLLGVTARRATAVQSQLTRNLRLRLSEFTPVLPAARSRQVVALIRDDLRAV